MFRGGYKMEPAKLMEVIFLDNLKDLQMVHNISGIISDISDTSLTVLMKSGKITVIPRQSLLEIKELRY